MEKSRIVVGAVNKPQQLEIIRWLTAQEHVEVIGPVTDAVDTLLAVRDVRADAVILPIDEDGAEPGLCSHMLAEYPGVLLLGISSTGERVVAFELSVFIRELPDGCQGLLTAIRLEHHK